jgi:RHS repeat-associated protein
MLMYVYDETGSPIAIKYRTSSYAQNTFDVFFFEKNLQGDIVAIYNSSGTKIGSYTYDAWGNFTVTTNSSVSLERLIVSTYNPFRYRGYYYDTDTSLYYLESRYYNPQWGRFTCGDVVSTISATLNQLTDKNLFAYCDNNPITRIDENGDFWNFVIGAAAGALISGTISAVSQLKENPEAWKTGSFWAHVGVDAAVGAINGTICASGMGVVGQAALNGLTSGVGDIAHQAINKGFSNVSLEQASKVAVSSAFTSVTTSHLANKFTASLDYSISIQGDIARESMGKAMIKLDAGKSSSAIVRQAAKHVKQYHKMVNIKQGTSSVIGSIYGSVIDPQYRAIFGGT